jgi:hypothetical protein
MVVESIRFARVHGKGRTSALWLEHFIIPAVGLKHLRFQIFSDMLWLVLVTWT